MHVINYSQKRLKGTVCPDELVWRCVQLTVPVATKACKGCRRRKIKCDATTSTTKSCSACRRKKLPCESQDGNPDVEEFFARHTSVIEVTTKVWAVLELRPRLEALWDTFSADVRKLLEQPYPYGSPLTFDSSRLPHHAPRFQTGLNRVGMMDHQAMLGPFWASG
jgi:hypothetical protein